MVANAETEERSDWAGWCRVEEAAAAETHESCTVVLIAVNKRVFV